MSNFKKIDQIVSLLVAQRERILENDEEKILSDWLKASEENRAFYTSIKSEANIANKIKLLSGFNKEEAFMEFESKIGITKKRKLYPALVKYAAILIPFIFILWFLFQQDENNHIEMQFVENEIHPGTSKAILKLADGTVVNLEKEKDLIADLDGVIVQNSSKEITYNNCSSKTLLNKIKYNKIEIPRGGEYQLMLSDSTKVWLNSETSLKFPVAFTSKTREVYLLSGEAFFEVSENKKKPFIVHTSKMDVSVLGTSFNVRAYSDENLLTTTLVEGEVLIKQPSLYEEYSLKPNQQAILSEQGINVKQVNVSKYIAWKNGRILFEDNTLDEIFSDLSRWYNIDVDFEDIEARNLRFSVDVKRYEDLTEILDILELTKKVSFTINENTLKIN